MFLKSKSRLTDREISLYFLQGLDPAFCQKVQAQLKAKNPRHHMDDPYMLAEITAAALFILLCNHAEIAHNEPSAPIKKEIFDLSQGFSNMNISAIAAKIAKQFNLQLITGGNQQLITRGDLNSPRI